MHSHPMLPSVALKGGISHPVYRRFLVDWREDSMRRSEDGVVAASACVQAAIIDIVLDGEIQHDWVSVMRDLLTENDRPIAYSRAYGDLLHKFHGQYAQPTVHAIHSRWWIELATNPGGIDHEKYASLIQGKRQTDGLIYDADVSPTDLRHRMQVELCGSMLMAVIILDSAGMLTDSLRAQLSVSIADPTKIPPRGFLTCEQFRLAALRRLGHENLFPVGIDDHLKECAEGLEFGWNDFPIKAKTDAHMGTAKRTARDAPIHSPMVTCHAKELFHKVESKEALECCQERLDSHARHLNKNPLDIPAFQMRDITFPFGADITPLETVGASWLIHSLHKEER